MNLPTVQKDSLAAVYLDIRPGAAGPEPLGPLGPALTSGGTGTLYRHPGDPARIIKLYADDQVDAHALKVAHMVNLSSAIQPADARRPFRFAWPLSCIVEQSALRRPLGFSMDYFDPERWTRLDALINAHVSNRAGVNTSYRYRVLIALHLAQALDTLHAHGIQFVDLKPANVMIERNGTTLALIDCDSMRFVDESGRVHPALMTTPDYTAPEYQGVDPRAMRDPEAQDRFAFAAMAFQLLNMGLPPFSGIVPEDSDLPEDTAGKIAAGAYAYGFEADERIRPNPRSLHTTWPRPLRRLFDAALGGRDRPEMSEWVRELSAAHASLVRCTNGHDHFPGTCPICHGTGDIPPPERVVPERRSSFLFRFNLIAATLALLAVGVAWAVLFRETTPQTPPAQVVELHPEPAKPATPPKPAAPAKPATAEKPATPKPAAEQPPAPTPHPAPAAQTPGPQGAGTGQQPVAPGDQAPYPQDMPHEMPLDVPQDAPQDLADAPPMPLPLPRPAMPPPRPGNQQAGGGPSYYQPGAGQAPPAPYSTLPYAQRLGLPQNALVQARWLDGRAADMLARALDQYPDGTDVLDRVAGGGILRARVLGTSGTCRDVAIYATPRRDDAFVLRFCPDRAGRWIGQNGPRY
ncbi:protein kinase domain-containing protein [Xanthobacteraceae bacterium A53D]